MIVDAQIKFKDILAALDVKSIPGCDDGPDDLIEFIDCADIDECNLPECDLCNGEGRSEPDFPAVDGWLIQDFVAAIRAGDIRTAQCLVGRVFELTDDIGVVDQTLRAAA